MVFIRFFLFVEGVMVIVLSSFIFLFFVIFGVGRRFVRLLGLRCYYYLLRSRAVRVVVRYEDGDIR